MTQESGRYVSLCVTLTLTVARLLDSSSSGLGFLYVRFLGPRLLHDLRVCFVGDKIPAAINVLRFATAQETSHQ